MTDAQHVLFNIEAATFTLKYKGSEKFLLEQLTEVAKEFANMPFNGNVANLPNGSDQQSENKIIKSDLDSNLKQLFFKIHRIEFADNRLQKYFAAGDFLNDALYEEYKTYLPLPHPSKSLAAESLT